MFNRCWLNFHHNSVCSAYNLEKDQMSSSMCQVETLFQDTSLAELNESFNYHRIKSYIWASRSQKGGRCRQVMTLALFSMQFSSKRLPSFCWARHQICGTSMTMVASAAVILCAGFDRGEFPLNRGEGRTGGDIGNLEDLILSALSLGLINAPQIKSTVPP